MVVQDLFIYPVKSLAGIKIDEAYCLQKGFRHDRRWMLVDERGISITQRIHHSLALLKTTLIDEKICISHKKSTLSPFYIPANPKDYSNKIMVTLWDDVIECFHFSKEADAWFSNYLQIPCKLVYMFENTKRQLDQRYSVNDEQVSFADVFPYMLISQASLDDLNSRLELPVPMNRFRPSIVVAGAAAFEEDTWTEIKIGNIHFKVAKPCSRCVLTTVNQDTAELGKEPLYTLSKYRTVDNKIMFGQNLIALNEGWISSNSSVEVLKYK